MATDGAVSRIVEVTLPNGATALVRAVNVDGGATKTKFGDRFDFTDVAATLEGLSEAIRTSLVKAAPDTVTVELASVFHRVTTRRA